MPSLSTAPIVVSGGRWKWLFCLPSLEKVPGVRLCMLRATATLRWFLCLALCELLRPNLMFAQDSKFLAAGTGLTTPIRWMDQPPSTIDSAGKNPFLPPSPSYSQNDAGSPNFADTLAFQFDRGGTSAWLTETYLSTPHTWGDLQGNAWSNGLAAGGSYFFSKTNTTAVHFMSNLDSSTTHIGGLPFEQYDGSYLTIRWGISRLFFSNSVRHELQLDVAGYGERMVAPPHLPIAFYMLDPTGYAVSSSGMEATFSLPSRNAVWSVRYGSERMVQQPAHGRLLQFQLSWNW